jgi:RimJ/RimL family protein N-acetyltransferase
LNPARQAEAAPALRPAREADCDLLFRWVNAPDYRAAALSGAAAIDRAVHEAWFAARLADPDSRIRIIEIDGAPVGVVRLEGAPEDAAISIFVERDARRQGLAALAIECVLSEAAESGALNAIARVRSDNAGSRRLFESLGFALAETRPGHVVYRRAVPAQS